MGIEINDMYVRDESWFYNHVKQDLFEINENIFVWVYNRRYVFLALLKDLP